MEYEYHIPFDKAYFFGWTRYLLMKRTIIPDGKFIYAWEFSRCIFAVLSAILFTMHNNGKPKINIKILLWDYILSELIIS